MMLGLIALAGLIAAWWWVVNIGKKRAWSGVARHLLGGVFGFLVFGVVLSIGDVKDENVSTAPVAAESPDAVPVESDVALLDGAVPAEIIDALDGFDAKMSVSNGILMVTLPEAEVTEFVYKHTIRRIAISRWPSEEDSDAQPDTPYWDGITEIRVRNASGSQGWDFKAGSANLDGIKGLAGFDLGDYILPRSTVFGKLTQADKDAMCRQDVKCWAEKHIIDAEAKCGYAIERLAEYQHKWTNGWTERKFHHFIWKDEAKDIIIYGGDRIQFQNGFGAWQPHRYLCEFDPSKNMVISVGAEPGRF